MITVHSGSPRELSLAEAYPVLKLRVDVFVVEQHCAYAELDGRDLEPDAIWLWTTDDSGAAISTLRILAEADGSARIGRVATAATARSDGTASRLMRQALETIGPGRAIRLEAQSYLEGWYSRFGFEVSGPEYVEDGIPHVPMTLGPPAG